MDKEKISIVLAINVHEKVEFLMKQFDNLKEYVKSSYCVILNCNNYMYNELKDKELPKNVYINPEVIDKRLCHGSLTAGIYSNMKYALEKLEFRYYVVLSSRNRFYREMRVEDLDKFKRINKVNADINRNYNAWWWPYFLQTKLVQYYKFRNTSLDFLCGSAHEGLTFEEKNCKTIVNFLENQVEIKIDLLNFPCCVEEFGLQTICVNECENGTFLDIGRGVGTEYEIPKDEEHFIYKILRQ